MKIKQCHTRKLNVLPDPFKGVNVDSQKKTGNSISIAILIFFITLITSAGIIQAQEEFRKNPHVSIQIKNEARHYKVNYTFKDHWGILRDFSIKFPAKATKSAIDHFGVPENFLEPYPNTESVLMERDRLMKRGMFYLENNILKVDKSAVINFYSETYGKPIAENIIRLLRQEKQDTRRNRIEFTMKFIQDIPYAIPEAKAKHKFNGGIFVPPQVLIKGYGDCDSKTLLFVSILVHLINPDDIVFLGQKGHVLSGIKMKDVSGMTYYTFRGDHYAIAETAGPSRLRLGEKRPEDQNRSVVEALDYDGKITYDPPVDEQNSQSNSRSLLFAKDCIKIKAKNEYQKPVKLIIEFLNPIGNWQTGGWYHLAPGQEKLIAMTNNKYFYYYAVADDLEWSGEKDLEFEGKVYGFDEVLIDQLLIQEYGIILSGNK